MNANNSRPPAGTPRAPLRLFDDESHCLLRRTLLTLDDLGPGWASLPIAGGRAHSGPLGFCDVALPPVSTGVATSFRSDLGWAEHRVYVFDGTTPDAVFDALERSCRDETLVRPATGPRLGDRSLWYDMVFGDRAPVATILIASKDEKLAVVALPHDMENRVNLSRVAIERLGDYQSLPAPTPEPSAVCSDPVSLDARSARLREQLPTIAHLPPGFVAVGAPACPVQSEQQCLAEFRPSQPPREQAWIAFRGPRYTTVGFEVWRFGEGAGSEEYAASLPGSVDGRTCTEPGGDVIHFGDAPQPLAATESAAWVAAQSSSSGQRTYVYYQGAARDGDLMLFFAVSYETVQPVAAALASAPDDEIVRSAIAAAGQTLERIRRED